MRLKEEYQDFFKKYWQEKATVYLFGSRTDDKALGGDIDIMLVTENKIHHAEIYKMKEIFYLKFGKQKLDVKVINPNEKTKFATHIIADAIPL